MTPNTAGDQLQGTLSEETVSREDFDKMSSDLTRAKNLLVRLWDKHPEARAQIEGSTGSWFVWGADRSGTSLSDAIMKANLDGLLDSAIGAEERAALTRKPAK
jgi:hypothetical protein